MLYVKKNVIHIFVLSLMQHRGVATSQHISAPRGTKMRHTVSSQNIQMSTVLSFLFLRFSIPQDDICVRWSSTLIFDCAHLKSPKLITEYQRESYSWRFRLWVLCRVMTIHTSCCCRADSRRSLGRGSTVFQHKSWPAPWCCTATVHKHNTLTHSAWVQYVKCDLKS